MKKAGKITEDKIADQLSLIREKLADIESSVRGQEIKLRLFKDDMAIIKQEQRDLNDHVESIEKFVKDKVMGALEEVLGNLRKLEGEMKIRAYHQRETEERVEKLEQKFAFA